MVDLLEGVAKRDLKRRKVKFDERYAATVMLVAEGYPGSYRKGTMIYGLNFASECIVFHAGTLMENNVPVTNGGRVLSVTGMGASLYEALEVSYRNAGIISWDGIYYRTDIGYDLM